MLKEDYETKLTTLGEPFEPYSTNRNGKTRLEEIQREQLDTKQIFPYRMVIRFNSTYLEMMDSWEFIRGRAIGLALPMWALCLGGAILGVYMATDIINKGEYTMSLFLLFLTTILIWLIYSYYKICRSDLFGYTHYPLRFNRKTQKVYAFSPWRRKIIELNWHELRFSAIAEQTEIELRASIVDHDNRVTEEIVLPYRVPRHRPELAAQHIAFFKAYMEGEDLAKIDQSITEFYDVYQRKETMKESFERLYMRHHVYEKSMTERSKDKEILFTALYTIIWSLQFIFKRIGLIFSKIPQWPAHIEQECQIEAHDPYDSTHQQRHLPPLTFTASEIALIVLFGVIEFTLLFGFWIWLAITSLNR